MGRAIQNLKIYLLGVVATFLLMTLAGIWQDLGFNGPIDVLGMILGPFIKYPELTAGVLIIIGFIWAADRIADQGTSRY